MSNRISRYRDPLGKELKWTTRDPQILRLFSTYRILRTNWIHAFFPESGDGHGLTDRLTDLYDAGLLGRFIFNGKKMPDGKKKNNNEMFSYFRTEKGDAALLKYQHAIPPFNSHKNAERALMDKARASLALGAIRDGRKIDTWSDICAARPALYDDPHPFRFYLSEKEWLTFDGEPCRVYDADN